MTTTYYKATRPDGTDFHSGKIHYEVGKVSLPAPTKAKPALCGTGVLHASDAVAETLIGGWWPCRLFQVSGAPILSEGHKHGFTKLRVTRELAAWRTLGPNGKAVAAFLSIEVPRVAAAWGAARGAARGAAWNAAW